jgi:hypothetical protein
MTMKFIGKFWLSGAGQSFDGLEPAFKRARVPVSCSGSGRASQQRSRAHRASRGVGPNEEQQS